jgi:hypothetical protein
MRVKCLALLGAATWCAGQVLVLGQSTTVKREIDVAYAPIEAVRPVLEAVLTPQGRFVMLPQQGAVLVIDLPEAVLAAEEAIAAADLPAAEVSLDFQFVTAIPARAASIVAAQQVPFPAAFSRPRIIVGPNGLVTGVIPATPTKFQTRSIGVTSESTASLNPDGSVSLELNTETSAFEGFVQYGSGVFTAGRVGAVAVPGQAANPLFFAPFVEGAGVFLPILSTTRIRTSVVLRPRVHAGVVHLDLMPRLEVELDGSEAEPESVDLKQFHSVLEVRNGELGRIRGFAGADEEFNRQFLGAKDPASGGTAIVVKAKVVPASGER